MGEPSPPIPALRHYRDVLEAAPDGFLLRLPPGRFVAVGAVLIVFAAVLAGVGLYMVRRTYGLKSPVAYLVCGIAALPLVGGLACLLMAPSIARRRQVLLDTTTRQVRYGDGTRISFDDVDKVVAYRVGIASAIELRRHDGSRRRLLMLAKTTSRTDHSADLDALADFCGAVIGVPVDKTH